MTIKTGFIYDGSKHLTYIDFGYVRVAGCDKLCRSGRIVFERRINNPSYLPFIKSRRGEMSKKAEILFIYLPDFYIDYCLGGVHFYKQNINIFSRMITLRYDFLGEIL